MPAFSIVLGVFMMFQFMVLHIKIEDENICFRFAPFHRHYKCICKSGIQQIKIMSYDPISDYRGWGIRYSAKATAYTTSGHYGMLIKLLGGKNILLGTQNRKEVINYLTDKGYKELMVSVNIDSI